MGAAAPAAAAANALRMKSRRPFLASAKTSLMPLRVRKFSGAFCTRPESMLSSFTQTPVFELKLVYSYVLMHTIIEKAVSRMTPGASSGQDKP
jgi:hypothetical protein